MDFSLFPTSIRTIISALQIVRFATDVRVEQKQKIISAIHFPHSFRKPPSAALYLPHLPPNAPYFVSRETQPSLIPTTNRHPPFSSNTPLPTQTALYTREAAAPSLQLPLSVADPPANFSKPASADKPFTLQAAQFFASVFHVKHILPFLTEPLSHSGSHLLRHFFHQESPSATPAERLLPLTSEKQNFKSNLPDFATVPHNVSRKTFHRQQPPTKKTPLPQSPLHRHSSDLFHVKHITTSLIHQPHHIRNRVFHVKPLPSVKPCFRLSFNSPYRPSRKRPAHFLPTRCFTWNTDPPSRKLGN